MRWLAYMRASGVHCETPVAPWIWIASSMIWQTRSGTIAFTAIHSINARTLERLVPQLAADHGLDDLIDLDQRAREMARTMMPMAETLA